MKPNSTRNRCIATCLAAVATTAITASAYPIEVPNWSFEVPRSDKPDGLAEGEDVYMEPTKSSQFWRQYNVDSNGGPQRYWNPGTAPNTGQRFADTGFGGIAPDGDHVGIAVTRYNDDRLPDGTSGAYVRDFEALCQILENVTFDPSEEYTLTVDVGHPPGDPSDPEHGAKAYAWNGYAVQLLAGGNPFDSGGKFTPTVYGGTLIAEDNNSQAIAVNTFQTISVKYTPGDLTTEQETALAGLPLQIRLCALEGPDHALTSVVAFDKVLLDGPPPPPVMAITPPAAGQSNLSLEWTSYAGRQYKLLGSSDLINWTEISTGIATNPPTNTLSVAPDGATKYYLVDGDPAP